MTPAVHKIGRINQRANMEGIHNGEEESISLSSGLPEIWKQHVTQLATHIPVRSTQVTHSGQSVGISILPKLIWSFLFFFFLLDMWISLCGFNTMVEPQLLLLLISKTSYGNNHSLLLYTISCLIFVSYL